ncbi:glycosyltransferase [Acinetobacter defluvii]|uniref:glycosyltransferase n=1 Tax=Acinetobacter defluvii TaxID=1871111 RepID=UPI003AF972D3
MLTLKVAHLTSVHMRYDTRIFLKECMSLSLGGFETHLVVADGHGDEIKSNVCIHDIGKPKSRLDRVYSISKKVLRKAIELDADVYHLHDPELILIGLKLIKKGKKVIFDAHEDFPKQILTKHYIPISIRKIISESAKYAERILCAKFSGIVGATPHISNKFSSINHNVVNINNYPKIDELTVVDSAQKKNGQICYIGGISEERGIKEVVKATELTSNKVTLALAGKFFSEKLEQDVSQIPGWKNIDFIGFIGRSEIHELLASTQVGLVTLHPTLSYLDSLPIKLFEYMCAGIPVIASDFPLWRDIVLKYNCGLCVDPKDSKAIAEAIDYLIDNPDIAKTMGNSGFNAIQTEFNWFNEEIKLLNFYEKMIGMNK